MSRFILIRVLQMVIALLILSMVIFGVIRIHGDPVLQFLSMDSTQQDYERVRAYLGLDKPIIVQYGIFLTNAVKGDFGKSIFTGKPVIESITNALPKSFSLILVSFVIAMTLAIPLGVLAAANSGKLIDTFVRFIAGMGLSLPSFWVGLVMMQIFAVLLGVLPTSGMDTWKHYILPASVLAFMSMPGPIRLIRSSMLEVLDSEYIKFARIKGVSERTVIWKHAFRNSLLPVLGFTSVQLAMWVAGAVVIETVFAWPGIGRLAFSAISKRDFPLIQGIVLVTAFLVILINLFADILYAYIDPRIRLKT